MNAIIPATAQLVPIPMGAGIPETAAARAPSEFDDTIPAFSPAYVETEYLLAGTASTFAGRASEPAVLTSRGHPYTTRVLARYPQPGQRFSGRVVIEPFNTTYGVDRDALWLHTASMLQVHGDAWIGISTRASCPAALRGHDPRRYADVDIASNDLAWSLLATIGAIVKHGGRQSPVGHLPIRHIYLGGYSQSGVDTATFAAAFGARTRLSDGRGVYSGFFPACHAASFTPLATGAQGLPRFEYAAMPAIGVPVIEVQPQTDVEGFRADAFVNPGSASVRRDDNDADDDRFRLYEIAGAPHTAKIAGCDGDGSTFPMSAFVRAALTQLFRWAEHDLAPPRAPRIILAVDDTVSAGAVDRDGNAVGGVPSPFLDVPVARYDAHTTPGPLCQLAGRETALSAAVLADRYGDLEGYLVQFSASLDAAIDAGFLLADDRADLLADQQRRARAAFAGTPTVVPT